MARVRVDQRQAHYRRVVSSIVLRNKRAEVIDLMPYLCDVAACRVSSSGFVLYRDEDHLGINASIHVVRNGFSARLAELMGQPQAE